MPAVVVTFLRRKAAAVGSFLATQARPGWGALTSADALAASRPKPMTPDERAEALKTAHQLKADVNWCLQRAAVIGRRAQRAPSARRLKEADVYQLAARALAQDAMELVRQVDADDALRVR